MDGLIVLLIIIGVISSISKSNKKKKSAAKSAKKTSAASEIPSTRAEWDAYLKENGVPIAVSETQAPSATAPNPAPAQPSRVESGRAVAQAAAKARRRRAQESAESAAAPAPRPARSAAPRSGSLPLDFSRDPEGETEAEHAAHQMKAAAAEARRSDARAVEQALAELNLRTLRSAVIMKEILDKPVALRPRGRR